MKFNKENFNFITNTIILLILVFGGIGYSVGFHFPNEILPGQFADGNYSFNGSVSITGDLNLTGNTNNYKIGTFTRDMTIASGTQVISGVGFKPSLVQFIATMNGGNSFSIGFDDGISPYDINEQWVNGQYGSNVAGGTTSISYQQAASTYYWGKIQSMDSEGFTFNWTKSGSPTGTLVINYIAFR